MPTCTDCGGTVIEYDASAGNGFCIKCGTVIEENTIISEVTFGETGSGAAMVQGSYVGQGSTHARMNGPFGNRNSNESREQTIANANRKIQNLASAMRLSEVVCLAATRLYTLAIEYKFTKGRKSLNVVAVCLYVACRQKETRNYMLIDFSDLLQVNVYELGHTYLQFVQCLNLRLPLIDPSHYISRFSALLEFGSETARVSTDAIRLIQRFDRDWMTKGRRPAGICGAALLLAARMNNFRRSVAEIVQVVKIADSTIKKRLEEFSGSGSGGLSVADFRSVWLEEEMDPPAFVRGKEKGEKREAQLESDDEDVEEAGKKGKRKVEKQKRKGKKRKRGEEEEIEVQRPAIAIDPALLQEGILAGAIDPPPPSLSQPLFLPDEPAKVGTTSLPPLDATDTVLAEEVSAYLQNTQGTLLQSALDEADARRKLAACSNTADDDELGPMDEFEDELNAFLLSEEEVKIKERVWVEMNRDYLESIAAKAVLAESGASSSKSSKRRKTSTKPRDASTPAASTTAESVRNLIKKNPRYSKRINYDALKDLFVDMEEDKKELYTMDRTPGPDPDLDMIGQEVIEEEGGAVGVQPLGKASRVGLRGRSVGERSAGEETDGVADTDADEGSERGFVINTGWDDVYDVYEQEV